MTKLDWQWLCAWALVFKKKLKPRTVARLSELPFPKEMVMFKCGKCKSLYHDICIDCSYRNGGTLRERGEWNEDTLHGFSRMMARDEMAETLSWMRGYNNPNLRF